MPPHVAPRYSLPVICSTRQIARNGLIDPLDVQSTVVLQVERHRETYAAAAADHHRADLSNCLERLDLLRCEDRVHAATKLRGDDLGARIPIDRVSGCQNPLRQQSVIRVFVCAAAEQALDMGLHPLLIKTGIRIGLRPSAATYTAMNTTAHGSSLPPCTRPDSQWAPRLMIFGTTSLPRCSWGVRRSCGATRPRERDSGPQDLR